MTAYNIFEQHLDANINLKYCEHPPPSLQCPGVISTVSDLICHTSRSRTPGSVEQGAHSFFSGAQYVDSPPNYLWEEWALSMVLATVLSLLFTVLVCVRRDHSSRTNA